MHASMHRACIHCPGSMVWTLQKVFLSKKRIMHASYGCVHGPWSMAWTLSKASLSGISNVCSPPLKNISPDPFKPTPFQTSNGLFDELPYRISVRMSTRNAPREDSLKGFLKERS